MGISSGRRHVVILGAGFGGLYAAKALRKVPVDVTVIDRRNHHVFQPLLYQVATAGLNPSDIAAPVRKILRRQRNLSVLLGEARGIDVATRRVVLDDGEISYDYLIVATGATHSYFGHDDWLPHAPGLKSIEDALEIRRRLLLCFERAEKESSPELRRALLTLVVVGGGPTGVELAGSIAEMARHTLRKDFRNIDTTETRIILIEAAEGILPTFPESLAKRAHASLKKLRVEVLTSEPVVEIDASSVTTTSRKIDSGLIMWAAGVTASAIGESLGAERDKAGRVIVNPDLSVDGHPEVFVIGDLAHAEGGEGMVPGVAQAAMQMGASAAANIGRDLDGRPRTTFEYADKGMLAIIGRSFAVADLRRIRVWGFPGVVLWLLVHIWFLIGFRNRLLVILQWLWAYLTWERGARLITDPQPQNDRGGARN